MMQPNQELTTLVPEGHKPSSIHELFAGWEDDGVRAVEMDWGYPQGNEPS